MALILGSTSSARADLLKNLKANFSIRAPQFDESSLDFAGDPVAYCEELALQKNLSILSTNSQEVILTFDTVVYCENTVFNKPLDYQDAYEMLKFFSGKKQQVITGICVSKGNERFIAHETTDIEFNILDEHKIKKYLLDPQYLQCSGSCTLSGMGSLLIKSIQGSYENVIGIPLNTLEMLLNRWGLSLWD
jgi:septum formation protein